jgi:hypothetical protein
MKICLLLGSCLFSLLSCGVSRVDNRSPEAEIGNAELKTAEALIDAFYSFDKNKLASLLALADESRASVIYYQGWAKGGNYKIVERKPCVATSLDRVSCAITVEDDPMLALKLDFNVTDTFTIAFVDGKISAADTSSNDMQIYYDAREWVEKNYPELIEKPCIGFFVGGPTPGDCAKAMALGYARFAASEDYPSQ